MAARYDLGNLVWGLLLLFLGVMFLLDNSSLINFELGNLWRLWPLLIVAAGVSLLSIKGWTGTIVSGGLVVLMIGLVGLVSLGYMKPGSNVPVSTQRIDVALPSENIDGLNLTVTGGAGNIKLDTADVSNPVKVRLESNSVKLKHDTSVQDGVQFTTVALESANNWWLGNYRNDLFVTVSEKLPVELKIDAGASDISADVSELNLKNMKIDAGASRAVLKLGNRAKTTELDVDMGASTLELQVPKDAGIAIDIDAGLSEREIPGLRKVSDNRYESSNYASAGNKIIVRGSIGISNLKLSYY